MTTTTLRLTDVDLVYDVHGPLPTPDGRPPLVLIGQPMDAGGFASLLAELTDATTVTYDPRGLGRSTRSDGRVDHDPTVHADDVAALIDALAAGPVDLFASSGGAVTALALVARHPTSVRTLIAHEPPLLCLLDDADAALRAEALVGERYQASGWAAGMASFLAMTAWQGPFTEQYFDQPDPDPAQFGMPAGRSRATTAGSWAASTALPVSQRHSPHAYARCSQAESRSPRAQTYPSSMAGTCVSSRSTLTRSPTTSMPPGECSNQRPSRLSRRCHGWSVPATSRSST